MHAIKCFCFVIVLYSALFADNLDTPGFLIEADAVGVVFPARTKLTLLYNADNNYVATHSRSLKPYWTGTVRGSLKLSPDDYQTMNIWFLGPIHLLYRLHLERTTNDFKEYTVPYTTADWSGFYDYKYKDNAILYQGGALYEYHLTPEYQDYFSVTVKGGARLIYFKDDYYSRSIVGGTVNHMNIFMTNNIVGPEVGFKFIGRPMTCLSWNLNVSGGIYGNWARKKIYLEDLGGDVVANSRFNRIKVAGSVDADLGLQIRMNHLTISMAAFYGKLISMASAVAQLGQTKNFTKVSSSESIAYTGLRAGFEFSW